MSKKHSHRVKESYIEFLEKTCENIDYPPVLWQNVNLWSPAEN